MTYECELDASPDRRLPVFCARQRSAFANLVSGLTDGEFSRRQKQPKAFDWRAGVSPIRQAIFALALILAANALNAQEAYPARSIKLWHGFGAGGNADIISRLIAAKLSETLGQQVVVDQRTGAGGNVASEMVSKLPPDGYNIILLTGGHAVSAAMYQKLPFDPVSDFSMISTVSYFPFVIGTSADGPIKSIADLIGAAKRDPGKLSFSSVGVGSTQHLAGELFSALAGVQMIHVPYRGGGAPVQDVITQRVSVLFDTLTPTMPHIRSGRLRALAVTSGSRVDSLPEVPSAADALPGYVVSSWVGVAAPPKLSAEIQRRLSQATAKAVAAPDVQQRLGALGGDPVSSSPEEMRALVVNEIVKWRKVVADARIERQ